MAKTKNPLFGFDARGTLANLLTFRHRDKQTIAESKPIPKDARTSGQLAWRTMYQLCADLWHTLTPVEQATWETLARRQHMTGYAYYLSQCLRPNPGIYLPLAGGTMSGDINMATKRITNLPAPVADEEPWRKIDAATASIPAGIIAMWSGLLANIPTGWALCDGAGGRPDLRSKFIKGAAAGINPGVEGGANTHTHPNHQSLSHSGAAVDAHSEHAGTAVADHAAKNSNTSATGGYYGIYGGEYVVNTQHTHWITAYTHSVTQPGNHNNHAVTQPSAHAEQAHTAADNQPVFYSLAFIIKL